MENMTENRSNGPRPTEIIQINFEPCKWHPISGNQHNVAERTFVTDTNGALSEMFSLGNWSWNWSNIETAPMFLQPNTNHVFTFWLNGGENDRSNEVCQFRIKFSENDDAPAIYRLNRHYIKPDKYCGGWYRYAIPFNSGPGEGESSTVTLEFCAQYAPCAIRPDKEEYDSLPSEPLPDERIPQRHNIVFRDGYPRDSSWSHLVFGNKTQKEESSSRNGETRMDRLERLFNMGILEDFEPEDIKDLVRDLFTM